MRLGRRLGVFGFVLVTILSFHIAFISPAAAESPQLMVTVMTRNMFTGADLTKIAAATNEAEFQAAVLETIENVKQSNLPGRAALLAAEIASSQPDLVALQEATAWRVEDASGPIVLDQLELLLASLDALGQHYKAALVHHLTEVDVAGIVTYEDRDAILMRSDLPPGHLMVLGTETHLYDALLPFNVLGENILVLRGWMALDVKIRGARFKFVNTHLEAPLPDHLEDTQGLQFLQAMQLVGDLEATSLPVILAGDFNSDAEHTGMYPPDMTPSYDYIASSGYMDAWEDLLSDDPGLTWPLMSEVGDPVDLLERIDLIFSKGPTPIAIARTGMDLTVDGLFASDHAGVLATFDLENHRPEKKEVPNNRLREKNRNPKAIQAEEKKANGRL